MRFEHLYIHVPFCARRCVYCDFAIAVRSAIPVDVYRAALERELEQRHDRVTLDLATVYMGGGTPSKLGAEGIVRLMDVVRRRATIRADAEVTIEVNPEDVTAAVVRAWADAGVNRLSIGVQSFDDAVLKWMHRTHDSAAARRAVRVARDAGVSNVSLDLIFAAPSTLNRDWPADLDAALSLEPAHLSVYGLTVEERTPLGRWVARQTIDEAPEETFAHEFSVAHRTLTSAGFEHYEVSNYGRPGTQSRHNWAYWQRARYAGVGPSAHEFNGATRRWNKDAYVQWEEAVAGGVDPSAGSELLDARQVAAEATYLGLRTSAGVPVSAPDTPYLEPWLEAGWARVDGSVVRLTPDGWLRLDSLAIALTQARSRY